MSNPLVFLSLLLALAPAAAVDESRAENAQIPRLTVHQRIIIRIPRLFGHAPVSPVDPVRWTEKKGPACIAMSALDGAVVTGPQTIDLMVEGGDRLRAKLDRDCPPLDFYSGFYLKATPDGMVCADRDAIRSRSGAACEIESFKRLVPKR
jgi:hypothetical protein